MAQVLTFGFIILSFVSDRCSVSYYLLKLWSTDPNTIGTRQSKQYGFSIYTFDNLKSKSMVRLVRAEKMVLSGLVFARKIARMILIQNI